MLVDLHVGTVDQDLPQRLQHTYIYMMWWGYWWTLMWGLWIKTCHRDYSTHTFTWCGGDTGGPSCGDCGSRPATEITAHIHLHDVVGILVDPHVGTVDQDLPQRLQHTCIYRMWWGCWWTLMWGLWIKTCGRDYSTRTFRGCGGDAGGLSCGDCGSRPAAEITAHVHLQDVVGMLADRHVGIVNQDLRQRLQHTYIYRMWWGCCWKSFRNQNFQSFMISTSLTEPFWCQGEV